MSGTGDAVSAQIEDLRSRIATIEATGPVIGAAGSQQSAASGPKSGAVSIPKRSLVSSQEGSPGPGLDESASAEEARAVVLRKLAVAARSRSELERELRRRKVPDHIVEMVLGEFAERRLIDDDQFARDWVGSRQQRRHLSRSALRRELTNKGVARETAELALATVGRDDEVAAARRLVDKRLRSMTDLAPEVRHRRLAGSLARRGFSASIINDVLADDR